MRFELSFSILVLTIAGLGCFKPTSSMSSRAQGDPCQLILDAGFRSVDASSSVLGPEGPAPSHQYLSFSGERFEWISGDISRSGRYTCEAGVIRAYTGNVNIEGRIEAERRILTWQGMEFEILP